MEPCKNRDVEPIENVTAVLFLKAPPPPIVGNLTQEIMPGSAYEWVNLSSGLKFQREKKILNFSLHNWPTTVLQKKDLYRREGKSRRCFWGDRIASISCRATYFAPERVEE